MGRKIDGLDWPGGEHDFALYTGQIEALQTKVDAGPEYIFQAIKGGSWRQEYIYEVTIQGLIGGGMPSASARQLVNRLKDDHPLGGFIQVSAVVLAAALFGYDEEDEIDDPLAGKTEGEAKTTTPEENGASQTSTASEQS